MLDQSFAPKNLVKIYHSENKKGVNVAGVFFPDVLECYEKIKRVRVLINKVFVNRRRYRKATLESRVKLLYGMKNKYEEIKNRSIEVNLEHVARQISSKRFSFVINKLDFKKNGKDVYVTNRDAFSFFAEKQIQKNIKYTYGVKQADRDLIVPQLRSVLGDAFPKLIIKTDIDSFYESIDQSLLVKKLNENPILSLSTRKLIAKLLRDYRRLSGQDEGVPRGIGISAYLSELYLKDFDRKIRNIDSLIYYSRYVDDIVIVISPRPGETAGGWFNEVKKFLASDSLSFKSDKSLLIDCDGKATTFSFDYLGYKFKKNGDRISLSISDKKTRKYKSRIDSVISRYNKNSAKQPSKSKKELFMRLRFLTSNTRLSNNKKNAVIGIYNSNKWATETLFLEGLDGYLRNCANSISDCFVRERVKSFSFQDGFFKRRFCHFSPKDLKAIVEAWRM